MTDLYPPRRRRAWLRAAAVLVVVAAAAAGAFTIGRRLPPASSAVTVDTPAPPWPAAGPAAAPVDTADTAGLPTVAGTARTAAGVPYGWPDSDAGAAAAAVVAVKAGLWFKYTLADPWRQLGFLAATKQQTTDRRARVTTFLTDPAPTLVGATSAPATSGGPASAGGPCGCGLAVIAAAVPAGQVAAEKGFATVRVTVVALTTTPAGVSATVSVVRVLLHWEGDWKLADAAVEPDAAGASTLPTGVPLPAPTWQA